MHCDELRRIGPVMARFFEDLAPGGDRDGASRCAGRVALSDGGRRSPA
jgi:hypothetical protein